MTYDDILALIFFILIWTAFSHATSGSSSFVKRTSLTQLMKKHRANWLRNALSRDLRMIDTQILAGLQNGTGFFASTSIFALGGCFALLGATDQVQAIYSDLPFLLTGGRSGFELKVAGLAGIFGYAFFKFGWSYRLFNYCSILFGGIPMHHEAQKDPERSRIAVERAIRMNILAATNFNSGLRAIFLSIGYLGWFISPHVFMGATLFVIIILTRRQFYSAAREALMDDFNPGTDITKAG